MVTKLICQLPNVDVFGRTGRLSFDPECVKDRGWVPNDWTHKFNPDHVKDISDTARNTPRDLIKWSRDPGISEVVQMLFIVFCNYFYYFLFFFTSSNYVFFFIKYTVESNDSL